MRLELTYPSRPFWIYQNFGESLACTEDTPDVPIEKRKVVTKIAGVCPPGYIELYPLLGMKGHTGMDLMAMRGVPLRSPIKGVVKEIQTEPERGLGVGVISDERFEMDDSGRHFAKVRQWHLLSISVKLGQEVGVGEEIGLADSTGLSSGDHNHFELKPVEYNSLGDHYNVFQNNGYYGSINPITFFNGKYADESIKHIFTIDMRFGDENDEVRFLQAVLRKLGYFTFPRDTGFYGTITREAVYKFQLEHTNLSVYERLVLKGSIAGPKTRTALNELVAP